MVLKFSSAVFLTLALLAHAVELRVATFNIGAHFTTSSGGVYYPDYSLGPAGTPDHDSVRQILGRIDADVVALEEIHGADISGGDVADLAISLGYPHVLIAPSTGTFDTTLRVAFLSRFPFLTQTSINSPAGAREMNRLIPVVKVDVPGTTRDPVLVAAHLKSGSAASDLFQRTIELRRLKNHLTTLGLTADDNFIVMGDFNLSSTNRTFTSQPASGLPGTFVLGADISFPINYSTDPTAYFSNPAVSRILPRQLDGSTVTFPSSGSTIDVFLASGRIAARPLKSEIYNSALDDSNSSGLPKSGSPLAGGTSATASDHLALFGDFEFDAALPYAFNAPGETVSESFAGFSGTYDPYPWATTGGVWQGIDAGTSTAPGFRAYGSAADPSLGFLAGAAGGSATASFVNHTAVPLTALQISYTAEQWRSAQGGTADTLGAELIIGGVASPLPALTFHAATHLPGGAVTGGVSTPKSATITGLALPPGAQFQLRFTFTPGAGGGLPPADLFINEFHYDNAGTDTGEFVEIVAGPGFAGNPTDIDLMLYNGNGGTVYRTVNLGSPEFTRTTAPGNFSVFVTSFAGSIVQNGPDGFALVNKATHQVIQFISYGGSVTATDGIASGMTSTNIGVVQTGTEAVDTSALGLVGNGALRSDFTWSKIAGAFSKGAANAGQSLANPILPPQGIAIDHLAVTFIPAGDSDGDGISDVDELLFGTDPQDASSRYALILTRTAADSLNLSFHRIATSRYVLETSTDLLTWSSLQDYPAGFDADTDVLLTITPGTPARFYRVRASAP